MMNKKTMILFMLLSCSLCGYSQVFWTAKAGMNLSRTTGSGEVDMKPGYQLGVAMDYYFNTHWGMQTSLILISKGYKNKGFYSFPSYGNIPPEWEYMKNYKSYDFTQNRTYVEIPVMLSHRFDISGNVKMALKGGVYGSYGIGGRSKTESTLNDGSIRKSDGNTFSDEVNRFDAGLSAGVDWEYKNRYIIGLMGEWGLRPYARKMKNQSYGLNIGYKF